MDSPGSRRLILAACEAGAAATRDEPLPYEQVEQRQRRAGELDLGRHLLMGYHGPWWSAEQLALLGTDTDEAEARSQKGSGMGKVILGAVLGLVLGVILGIGIKHLCDEDARGDFRKFSRLPVYKQNNAADLIEGIDITPLFPTVAAVLGGIVGAVAGATSSIVGAIRGGRRRLHHTWHGRERRGVNVPRWVWGVLVFEVLGVTAWACWKGPDNTKRFLITASIIKPTVQFPDNPLPDSPQLHAVEIKRIGDIEDFQIELVKTVQFLTEYERTIRGPFIGEAEPRLDIRLQQDCGPGFVRALCYANVHDAFAMAVA
jgi:hypothetical protein